MCQSQDQFGKDAVLPQDVNMRLTAVSAKIQNCMKRENADTVFAVFCSSERRKEIVSEPLLQVKGLKKYFPITGGVFGKKIGEVMM